MLKTPPAMCEPDERFQHLSFHDQAAGHIRPLCAGDLYNDVSLIKLGSSVPAEVRSQFDVARSAYLYSWFVYDFTVLAEQHSYIVLEMALRHRAKSEGLSSDKTLKPYLQLAIKRGWLREEELEIPGTSGSRPMSFLKELPGLRDRLAHGKLHLSPEFTLTMMRKCAELINKLYP
jgi:hypothetical protein